jgi:hypothetical protein
MGKVSKCSLIILAIVAIFVNPPLITLCVILVLSFGCCGYSEQQQMKVLKYCMAAPAAAASPF